MDCVSFSFKAEGIGGGDPTPKDLKDTKESKEGGIIHGEEIRFRGGTEGKHF